jgi:hypothetical protein
VCSQTSTPSFSQRRLAARSLQANPRSTKQLTWQGHVATCRHLSIAIRCSMPVASYHRNKPVILITTHISNQALRLLKVLIQLCAHLFVLRSAVLTSVTVPSSTMCVLKDPRLWIATSLA